MDVLRISTWISTQARKCPPREINPLVGYISSTLGLAFHRRGDIVLWLSGSEVPTAASRPAYLRPVKAAEKLFVGTSRNVGVP